MLVFSSYAVSHVEDNFVFQYNLYYKNHKNGTFLLNFAESLILISTLEIWQLRPGDLEEEDILSEIKSVRSGQVGL